jgi:membrane protease YdiL (CAAX protease family)
LTEIACIPPRDYCVFARTMSSSFLTRQGSTFVFATKSRALPLKTVAIGFVLIEAALWSPKSAQLWIGLVAAVWIIGQTIMSRRSADELGLGLTGLKQSAWVIAAALVAAGMLLCTGWYFGSLHGLMGPIPASTHVLAYSAWAFQQEFILQCFLFLNLVPMLGTRRAVVVAALIFSLAHLPNPILMCATLISGLCLTAAFSRYRNVYAVAIAHALLGLSVAVALPADLHRNMRVGLGYFSYRSVAGGHKVTPLHPPASSVRR